MDDKVLFLEKLQELRTFADSQNEMMSEEQIMSHFQSIKLTEDQIKLIHNYIQERRGREEIVQLTKEEQAYLEAYEKEMEGEDTAPEMLGYLKQVIRIAKGYAGRGLKIEDLIQEGNMGFMMALQMDNDHIDSGQIEAGIRRAISIALDEYEQNKASDEKMVNQVNELIDRIKELTEELGYRPSIDEVSHYLDKPAEEIRNLLYLAGEEVEEEQKESKEDEHHCDCHHHEH